MDLAPPPEPDFRWTLAAGVSVAVGAWVARPLLGLFGALGTDAPLWGLTARDLWVGAPPLVPPLYPALLAPWVAAGGSPVAVGAVVSALSLGALVAGGVQLARGLGMSPRIATLLGLCSLLLPDTLGWGLQLQPDATAAALSMWMSVALVSLFRPGTRTPRWRPALAVLLLGAVAPSLRAHGLVWAGVAGLALVAQTGPTRWLALALPAGVWLFPACLGVELGRHPLDVPWSDRAGGALAAFSASDPSSLAFLHELHRGDRQAYSALVRGGDRGGQLIWHALRSFQLAPDGWLILLAAGLSSARAHLRVPRVAALAPLLAALPALIIWSQRRHVMLVVPIALVVVGSAIAHRRGWLAAALLALAAHGALNTPRAIAGWQSERPRAEHYAELGGWLHENTHSGDLLGGIHQDVGLYAPALPRHDPDGTAADWRTFLVSDRPPPHRHEGTWTRVYTGPQLGIWQLDPQRTPRPCRDVAPPGNAAHLAIASAHIDLDCPEAP